MADGAIPAKPAGQGTGNRKSIAPWFFFALAALCFLFWIASILVEVQTSEAFVGGPAVHSLSPNWAVLWQPIQFANGTLPANMVAPVLVGWVVEVFYLIFTFVHEATHASVVKFNKMLSGVFKTLCWAVVAYDWWTDYNAGFVTGGFWQQVIFSTVLSAAVLFLGTAGIRLIQLGLSEW